MIFKSYHLAPHFKLRVLFYKGYSRHSVSVFLSALKGKLSTQVIPVFFVRDSVCFPSTPSVAFSVSFPYPFLKHIWKPNTLIMG